jgi:hypothetical protein
MAKQRNDARAALVKACADMGMTLSQACAALGLAKVQVGYYATTRGFKFRDGRRKLPFPLQANCAEVRMSGPGGAGNAHPGPDHGNLHERSDTMANAATIAESVEFASAEAIAR